MVAYWRDHQLAMLRGSVEAAYREGGLEAVERAELVSHLDTYSVSRPVGGLSARDRGLLPERLEYSHYQGLVGTIRVMWNGDALVGSHEQSGIAALTKQPSADEWRSFWRRMSRLNGGPG